MFVTDTIAQTAHTQACKKITVITIAGLLARAVQNIHEGKSISALFGLSGSSTS